MFHLWNNGGLQHHFVMVPMQLTTWYSFQPRRFCVYSRVTITKVKKYVSLTSRLLLWEVATGVREKS